jgi:hypothetical protein
MKHFYKNQLGVRMVECAGVSEIPLPFIQLAQRLFSSLVIFFVDV